MKTKKCGQCGKTKPVSEFYRTNQGTCGYRSPCKECNNSGRRAKYDPSKRVKDVAATRAMKLALKVDVITNLGGRCECCGEDLMGLLTVDHINNDGAEHARSLAKHAKKRAVSYIVHRDIINQGYPRDKYRVMCFSCNIGRELNGGECPHKTQLTPVDRYIKEIEDDKAN